VKNMSSFKGRGWPADPEAEIPDDIEGLIFDCDGTLVDTMPVHFEAWTEALAQVGLKFPIEKFYSLAGMASVPIIELLAHEQSFPSPLPFDPTGVAHKKEDLYFTMISRVKEVTVVANIARRERQRRTTTTEITSTTTPQHRKLAVASGGWKDVILKTLGTAGLADGIFDAIVGADEVKLGKPNPDVFLEAARRIGVDPKRCLVYEDADLGLQAAKAAGMASIDVRPWYFSS